jgi:hypothetical protein
MTWFYLLVTFCVCVIKNNYLSEHLDELFPHLREIYVFVRIQQPLIDTEFDHLPIAIYLDHICFHPDGPSGTASLVAPCKMDTNISHFFLKNVAFTLPFGGGVLLLGVD